MSATLEIINNFLIETQGRTITGKQGASTDLVTDAKETTVDGNVHDVIGSLTTATAKTVWDEDDDVPADWDYLYFWADQDCYIQLIGQTTNVVFPVTAGVPWVQYGDQLLAAANTTAISGSTPSVEDIDSVVIQNNSGNTMNYHFAVID